MIRLLLTISVATLATAYWGVRLIVVARRGGPGVDERCLRCHRSWARCILWAAGVRVTLEGSLPSDSPRPRVIIANHCSSFDIFALSAAIPVRHSYVMKEELRRIPIFRTAVTDAGHIFIARSNTSSAVESLRKTRDLLVAKCPTLIMFPEGTRSATGKLQAFKRGAFVLAIRSRADVIPAAVLGSYQVKPKNRLGIRPGTIRIRLGRSIPTDEYRVGDRIELAERARSSLMRLLGEVSH